jgi:phosphate transport system substrate-binding protein
LEKADAVLRKRPWAIIAVTDPESNRLVAQTPGAVGAATLTSVIVERQPLNRLSLDGVAGTTEAVAKGRYPLAKAIVFVTRARVPPAALAILDFACSAQGRAIAERAGTLVTGCGDTTP